MAGSEEQSPSMTTEELVALIHQAGRVAVERDTLYKEVKVFERSTTPVPDASLN